MKKYFGTDGIRGPVGKIPMRADWVLKLGWAAGCVFATSGNSITTRTTDNSRADASKAAQKTKIVIGKDTRISGYVLEAALQAGLISAGADILLLGPIPTPAIAFLTRNLNANAGIVISASHNPFQDNGIKFFNAEGYKLSDEMEFKIESQCDEDFATVASQYLGRTERVRDAEERYIHFCKSTFPKALSLQAIKLVLDCANGATYKVAPLIFKSLEAEVITLGVNPDGFNINEHCGSTHPELLAKSVLENKADLGIAFDGDGDRVVMVDHNGEILDGDELLFIIANWFANHNRLKGGVVGTVMSNLGLEHAIQSLGFSFARSAVGDHHILEKAQENGWNLAGESSGHVICLDSTTTGDGIITALQVLAASLSFGKKIAELKQGMKKYPQTLINISLLSLCSKSPVSQAMKEALLENPLVKAAITNAEKELQEKGRVLVRASGTEPLIRVMVEGQNETLVQNMAKKIANVLENMIEELKNKS